ncbi:MAG: GntR family transcriptional regulator [Nitrospirota bacterium]|nr:GntR family transcriptional regulator [Nitrospirota bacterium]
MSNIINRDDPTKLYMQLYEIMKQRIESGEWAVDSQIPIEQDLCTIYDLSKATVRQAVAELARQGYLKRLQGKGTFVCKRIIPEGLSMVTSFRELMLDAGIKVTTKVLALTIMMPSEDLDIKLDIQDDRHIIYLKRLRLVDNEPVLLQETFIPHHICPSLLDDDLENNSLHELLEKKYGLRFTKVQDYISLSCPPPNDCKALALKEDCSVLLLEQLVFSGDTQLKYTRSYKRPDRFKFFIELERQSL